MWLTHQLAIGLLSHTLPGFQVKIVPAFSTFTKRTSWMGQSVQFVDKPLFLECCYTISLIFLLIALKIISTVSGYTSCWTKQLWMLCTYYSYVSHPFPTHTLQSFWQYFHNTYMYGQLFKGSVTICENYSTSQDQLDSLLQKVNIFLKM